MKQVERWLKIDVEEKPKDQLTKAIASQILHHKMPTCMHPAMNYVLNDDEVLSEQELLRMVAKYSTGDCLGRWATLPGRAVGDTLQMQVTRRIVSSSFAAVDLNRKMPSMIFRSGEGQEEKVGISEGFPLVAPSERSDQYAAHKVAGLYLLVNPPLLKGKLEPEPLEAVSKTTGSMVPKECAQFRQWDADEQKHVGPFETIYAGKPNVHQIESVFSSQTQDDSLRLQSKTLEVIEPVYKSSKFSHHNVIGRRKDLKVVRKPEIKATLPDTLPKVWRMWSKAQILTRVASVYEPFYGCLLPNGLAAKVHVTANLMWTVRQLKCVGIAASSESGVWTKVKSLVELNLPIWSKTSDVGLKLVENGNYTPGVYKYFQRALQLVDIVGKAVPRVSSRDIQYFPNKIVETVTQMESTLRDTRVWTEDTPVAIVAYLDPCMAGLEGWLFYPLDFSSGQVIIARGETGFTYDQITLLFARFTAYRVFYPFGRVPWPALSQEIAVPPVIVRNGAVSAVKPYHDYFAESRVTFDDLNPLTGEEVSALVHNAEFTRVGPSDPIVEPGRPVPLPPKFVIPVDSGGGGEVSIDLTELGMGAVREDGDEDEEDMFATTSVTPQQAAALRAEQLKLEAEIKL